VVDAKRALDELQSKAMLMTSDEANLVEGTWTFRAPWFQCGAGEYLIISLRDWKDLQQRAQSEGGQQK
jgi:hypothetical protein